MTSCEIYIHSALDELWRKSIVLYQLLLSVVVVLLQTN